MVDGQLRLDSQHRPTNHYVFQRSFEKAPFAEEKRDKEEHRAPKAGTCTVARALAPSGRAGEIIGRWSRDWDKTRQGHQLAVGSASGRSMQAVGQNYTIGSPLAEDVQNQGDQFSWAAAWLVGARQKAHHHPLNQIGSQPTNWNFRLLWLFPRPSSCQSTALNHSGTLVPFLGPACS